MWSSIENLKENLNKIALDVHEDDDDEEDLHRYGSVNGVGDSDRRNSSGFRYSRSVSRNSIPNGIESPGNHEIERYKAEIKKLQESESDIKALSVNYAALLREKEAGIQTKEGLRLVIICRVFSVAWLEIEFVLCVPYHLMTMGRILLRFL